MVSKLLSLAPLASFILILIISTVLTGFSSSSSSSSRIIIEKEENRWRSGDSFSSTGYYSKISPSQILDDKSSIYGVSGRTVPQGPNPLHN
ncbi:hypothetical protein IEQ34_014084 [Dendrobium chrysotoxum]|uniref:Uncharacterized protein n=1 Tax=Dendrobium chrysotoxum TaxID=161865 RepID=A0AAV7GIX4_DENCH|nr:hypothetical protein IEQ34_014084 [Dendrobium chrysotoxum]